jgi:hypothetical protein
MPLNALLHTFSRTEKKTDPPYSVAECLTRLFLIEQIISFLHSLASSTSSFLFPRFTLPLFFLLIQLSSETKSPSRNCDAVLESSLYLGCVLIAKRSSVVGRLLKNWPVNRLWFELSDSPGLGSSS